MINIRRDLTANKNMNKYSTAGLGMLEPQDSGKHMELGVRKPGV